MSIDYSIDGGIARLVMNRPDRRNAIIQDIDLGKSDVFDRALADFAVTYADQNERDYASLTEAVRDGRIKVQEGL